MGLKDRARNAVRRRRDLEARVAQLETDVLELRRHSVRLAELLDVVEELLIPLADRDDERVAEAVEKYRRSL